VSTGPAIDHQDLIGRIAVVTGGSRGIGHAIAVALAERGADVAICYRERADAARETEAALAARGVRSLAVQCDVRHEAAVASFFGRVAAELGPVDILVNNAGVQHVAPIEEFPTERFDLILALMLQSPFRLIRHVLPHMYAGGWGRVVNVSSAHGLRASAYKSAYVSAKHGLEGLSKVVALEGAAHGVTSNCVNPAYVRTPLVEKQIADQAAAHGIEESEVVNEVMLAPVAVKRLIEPGEVADLVAFLCGPSSASITGAAYTMDGGWTAH